MTESGLFFASLLVWVCYYNVVLHTWRKGVQVFQLKIILVIRCVVTHCVWEVGSKRWDELGGQDVTVADRGMVPKC